MLFRSWATATRSIRKCNTRIEKIGGSHVDTEPTAWGLDVQVCNLLWTGEEAMKKVIPILKRAEFESVEDLPRTAVGFSSKAYEDLPPQLMLSGTLNGEQRVQVRVPSAQGLCLFKIVVAAHSIFIRNRVSDRRRQVIRN